MAKLILLGLRSLHHVRLTYLLLMGRGLSDPRYKPRSIQISKAANEDQYHFTIHKAVPARARMTFKFPYIAQSPQVLLRQR